MSRRSRPITGAKWKQQPIPGPRSERFSYATAPSRSSSSSRRSATRSSSGKRLGEILVDRGYVTPTQVSRVLAEQHELPFIDLARETVDMGAAGLLSEDARPPLQRDSRPRSSPTAPSSSPSTTRRTSWPRTTSASRSAPPSASASPPATRSRTRSRASTRASSTSTTGPRRTRRPARPSSTSARPPPSAPAIKQVNAVLSRAIDARRLRRPLHAAAQAPARPRPRRRRHARARHDPEDAAARGHEPPEGDGGARHRREARAAGRPPLAAHAATARSTCASRCCRRRSARR